MFSQFFFFIKFGSCRYTPKYMKERGPLNHRGNSLILPRSKDVLRDWWKIFSLAYSFKYHIYSFSVIYNRRKTSSTNSVTFEWSGSNISFLAEGWISVLYLIEDMDMFYPQTKQYRSGLLITASHVEIKKSKSKYWSLRNPRINLFCFKLLYVQKRQFNSVRAVGNQPIALYGAAFI